MSPSTFLRAENTDGVVARAVEFAKLNYGVENPSPALVVAALETLAASTPDNPVRYVRIASVTSMLIAQEMMEALVVVSA